MVGRLSRIRVSSVTRILPLRTSVGTLKSTRTSTRFPRTSKSRRVSFAISNRAPARALAPAEQDRLFGQHFHQLHAAIAVAPFVIVPADHFDETVAHRQRQFAVEDTGVRV